MPTKIRIGDFRHVRAEIVDQDGQPAFASTETYDFIGGDLNVIGFDEDPGDPGNPRHILVSGEAPGDQILGFSAYDNYLNSLNAQTEFTVVDANGFKLDLIPDPAEVEIISGPNPYVVRLLISSGLFQIQAFAVPIDEFFNSRPKDQPNYAPGLTNIVWTSQNGRFNFDVGGGPAVGPAVDTLELQINPVSIGDDVITVSAENSLGQQISTSFRFRVMGATTVALNVELT
jgi:hypothetical protein